MPSTPRAFFETYTKDFTKEDLGKLFTYETPEAYRFFARGINTAELEGLSWHRRAGKYIQGFFLAFTMRLSPARRVIYGLSLLACVIGMLQLFNGFGVMTMRMPFPLNFVRVGIPGPVFADGTVWVLIGFLLMNLLVLLEVADRLSLKRDLEVAREIQQALLLAMMRTLVDEGLTIAALVKRLNTQIGKHAPPSRFITLFVASYDPRTGQMEFVNAGQTPPLLRRQNGTVERLTTGGIALGLFEGSTYDSRHARPESG